MLSSLHFYPLFWHPVFWHSILRNQKYNGQNCCKLVQNRQLIAQLPKLIHWLKISKLFIHYLYILCTTFGAAASNAVGQIKGGFKKLAHIQKYSLILMNPNSKSVYLDALSNG